MEAKPSSQIDLPGFRFHPTEEELLDFYLRTVALGKNLNFDIIGSLNIYRYDPWELPGLAKIGEREWYFFVRNDRRIGNGGRSNRTTERGFWKATGSDRSIRSAADPKRLIGLKKTLVFYQGRAPRGTKTDWVMNEYRLPEIRPSASVAPCAKEDVVLCKIYRKATSMRELEQRAASEEEMRESQAFLAMAESTLFSDDQEKYCYHSPSLASECMDSKVKEKDEAVVANKDVEVTSAASATPTLRSVPLPELQVPFHGLDWMQEPFLTQLRSPWLDQWSPYANTLYF